MSEEKKLIQTKGSFQLKGMITGKEPASKGNGYTEGVYEKGKSIGSKYRSLRFLVKTSNENNIPVEIYGGEMEFATLWNNSTKKKQKVAWAERFNKLPNEWTLLTPSFDLAKKTNDDFSDGDFVFVSGDITFSNYTDANGKPRKQTKYSIKNIYHLTAELDFDSPEFEETNKFTQNIVVNEVEIDSETKNLNIYAYIIDWNGNFSQAEFEVNTETSLPIFVKTMKTLKFGDTLKVKGIIHQKAIKETVNGAWGEEVITEYKKCLEVKSADANSFEAKTYTQDDFVVSSVETDSVDWEKATATVTPEENKLPFEL